MRKIYTLGEEVLRHKSNKIRDIDASINDLAEEMLEAMYQGDGVGLAGPQVGVEKNIFVSQLKDDQERIFINPQIIWTSQERNYIEEGCLSIPGVFEDVLRPAAITVQAYDERGKPFKMDADGMLARVIQHEIDHLKGILFIDHLEESQRDKLLKVYNKN